MIARCGENPGGPAAAGGCGAPIAEAGDLFRCVDCATPFHRDCALAHFAAAAAAPIGVDWRRTALASEARGDRLLALLRRLAWALRLRVRYDDGCDCTGCAGLRAFDRFIAADDADRTAQAQAARAAAAGLRS